MSSLSVLTGLNYIVSFLECFLTGKRSFNSTCLPLLLEWLKATWAKALYFWIKVPHECFNIVGPTHFKCTPLASPKQHSQLSPPARSQFQLLNRKVLNYWLLSLWKQASKHGPQAQDLESKETLDWKASLKSLQSERLWWPALLSQAVHEDQRCSWSAWSVAVGSKPPWAHTFGCTAPLGEELCISHVVSR